MSSTTWQKLEIDCAGPVCESVAAYFSNLTGCGVEIRDNETGMNDAAVVIAYLASGDPSLKESLASALIYLQQIADLFPEYPPPLMRQDPLADEDWGRTWKEHFKPFRLTENLIVKPTWESYSPVGREKVVEIDPGMAFGTGLHASTRLAAMLMENHITGLRHLPARVLDIGTGTGILAICCAILGCKDLIAIDNDPDSISAARDNILINNVSERIKAEITPLESLAETFDLVIANIIHNTLVEMAPTINRLLSPNGTLIMAGILEGEQSRNISRIYGELGIRTRTERISGEWVALLLEKPAPTADRRA